MKCFLLATATAGDYICDRNGIRERAKAEILLGHQVGICVPVLSELYFGAENSRDPRRSMQWLHRALRTWRVWPMTNGAASEFGRLSAELRRLNRTPSHIHLQIAAIALTLGNTTVVSADSDLLAVPGLSVENWAAL